MVPQHLVKAGTQAVAGSRLVGDQISLACGGASPCSPAVPPLPVTHTLTVRRTPYLRQAPLTVPRIEKAGGEKGVLRGCRFGRTLILLHLGSASSWVQVGGR